MFALASFGRNGFTSIRSSAHLAAMWLNSRPLLGIGVWVPELTPSADIKLNLNRSLCAPSGVLRLFHRTLPYVRAHLGEVADRLYSVRLLRFADLAQRQSGALTTQDHVRLMESAPHTIILNRSRL